MKRWQIALTSTLMVVVFWLFWLSPGDQARGQPDQFIISNADATNTLTMTGSSGLNTLIQNVESRFVIQFANDLSKILIQSPPAGMVNLLQNVEDRFVLQYANGKNVIPITQVPSGLASLLQSTQDRYVIQYANLSNKISLAYPAALIGDTDPPTILSIYTSPQGAYTLVIVQTSEFTTAELKYGISSGNYSTTMTDNIFRVVHTFSLPYPQSGTTIYYQVTVVDRSGNETQSSEGILKGGIWLYLPYVRK